MVQSINDLGSNVKKILIIILLFSTVTANLNSLGTISKDSTIIHVNLVVVVKFILFSVDVTISLVKYIWSSAYVTLVLLKYICQIFCIV